MLGAYCSNLGKDNDDLDSEVVVGRLKKGSNERASKTEKPTGDYMTLQNTGTKSVY